MFLLHVQVIFFLKIVVSTCASSYKIMDMHIHYHSDTAWPSPVHSMWLCLKLCFVANYIDIDLWKSFVRDLYSVNQLSDYNQN